MGFISVINKIRAERGIDHFPESGGSVHAQPVGAGVIKFLDGDDVWLEALENANGKRLVALRIAIQIGRHDTNDRVGLDDDGSLRLKVKCGQKQRCAKQGAPREV